MQRSERRMDQSTMSGNRAKSGPGCFKSTDGTMLMEKKKTAALLCLQQPLQLHCPAYLIECPDFQDSRRKYFSVTDLYRLFRDVNPSRIVVGAIFNKLRTKSVNHYDVEAAERTIRAKREDQGNHECEVLSCGNEAAESGYAWQSCTKNPGHDQFIPAPEFRLDHLPEWARYSSVLEYVKLVSALTVRLRVAFTSWGRPKGYSFHNYRGSDSLQVGSGFVQDVYPGNGSCPCPQCEKSLTPAQEWICMYIETACHVVYDTKEAEATKVDFFYDDESSQTSGRMKTVFALDTMIQSQGNDFCVLMGATHDKSLGQEILHYKEELDKTLNLNKWRGDESDDFAYFLSLVVSHPHGCAKHITVGETERFIKDGALIKVRYTTDTCPGSSGAPVSVINFCKGVNHICLYKGRGPHSESQCVEGKTLNMSAEFLTSDLTNAFKFWAKRKPTGKAQQKPDGWLFYLTWWMPIHDPVFRNIVSHMLAFYAAHDRVISMVGLEPAGERKVPADLKAGKLSTLPAELQYF
ncbi:hypothetical protein PoB_005956200 [Plakobranchus ocellatus]|uniref:Peptidase S1 domain-containing protein n=1 Tax=Plakobranchus ocellatus TaxID=259542 RepID=A0AAV4CM66_9GAST|nr:hypothetical protein PoB_005956200 [Plakobranchus ocellatus]